ncbi:MAG: SMP-30/gluconolactonase/LRE family protein [Saprospiraceae bacterium]|jgi:gluconolactonase|nr:SMP-30/gluconolactonase/LRE family protein [Saprospiraceae bacterium]MBK6480079.1 SMP-30/gluconolactonase/LRE family protein [Saprospiraceae bacterium]MBK6815064.1 SMP-30/gluconolactonase/LRE family protein [Saprospiraceae bacterium]MBK7372107.1 SMP-30/gluconolactonase/LRE family protein [Saprospiraceae bacterium]MBK7435432.1 SMP-30/gluconolactonase/LRE family protein [Saprospiraceae bacterium]
MALMLVSGYNQDALNNDIVVAKGATPHLIASNFSFTEGPAADAKGNVYFTDQPNDRIMLWKTDGTLTEYMKGAGRSNGLFFDKKGNLMSCADEHNQLWQIDQNKNVTVLIKDFEGKRLNGPNDLWIHPGGGIYFTDPFYKRDYWDHSTQEITQQRVYYFDPMQNKIKIVADDMVRPNGIIGTHDGKTLYVADIGGQKTYVYQINSDGSLSGKKLFYELGSDGMTIDKKGNVYLTGKGVTVVDHTGHKIAQIPIDAPWTANVTFGGKNRKTLFITASKSVYTLDMKVKGVK